MEREPSKMKPYKQAKIPKGFFEIRFRGSAEDEGSFSAKILVPTRFAAEALIYFSKAPKAPKKKHSPKEQLPE